MEDTEKNYFKVNFYVFGCCNNGCIKIIIRYKAGTKILEVATYSIILRLENCQLKFFLQWVATYKTY